MLVTKTGQGKQHLTSASANKVIFDCVVIRGVQEKWMRSGVGAAFVYGQPLIQYAHPTWLSLTSKSQCVEMQR